MPSEPSREAMEKAVAIKLPGMPRFVRLDVQRDIALALDAARAAAVAEFVAALDKEMGWISELADEAERVGNPLSDSRAGAMRQVVQMVRSNPALARRSDPNAAPGGSGE